MDDREPQFWPAPKMATLTFDEAATCPIHTQSGPLPKGADVDAAFANFKQDLHPKLQSNSIQMLKLEIALNKGMSFFTRLGLLHEIDQGNVVWRLLASPGVNTVRLGMVIPANRALSRPAKRLSRRSCDDLHRYDAV
jgi:LysR substrate binding domain